MAAFAFFVSLEIFLAAVFLCIIPFVAVFAITDVVKPIFCWIFSLSLVSMVFCRHLTAVLILVGEEPELGVDIIAELLVTVQMVLAYVQQYRDMGLEADYPLELE